MSSNISNSKSNHYTSAKGYRDEDGLSRNFDFIDYSPKTKISMNTDTSSVAQELEDYRAKLISNIISLPAVYCPRPFVDFTLRGESLEVVGWNENMLKDEGIPLNRLRDLQTLLKNTIRLNTQTY